MTNDYKILTGNISKQLLLFFFPIWFGIFFQQLYNTIDALIVGRFLGEAALASVGGSTTYTINLTIGFFIGLASGAGVVISQFYGAKDFKSTKTAIETSMAISILGGIVIAVLGFIFSRPLLRLMNVPDDIMTSSLSYLNIFFAGIIAMTVFNVGAGVLRALGDSKRPLYYLMICCGINVALDLLFIAVFHMGVAGAAVATVIAQGVSGILVINNLRKLPEEIRFSVKNIKMDRKIARKIFKIGIPSGLQSMMYAISNSVIQTSINSFGTNTIAAAVAFSKLDAIIWMTLDAFSMAMMTFVGQNYGAGNIKRIRESIKKCMFMATIPTIVLSFLVVYFAPNLLTIFTDNEEVIEIGIIISKYVGSLYILFVPVQVFLGTFRGLGDTLLPTLMMILGVCGFRLLWLATVLKKYYALTVLFTCYPLSWLFTSLMMITYYLVHVKKKVLHYEV